MNRFEVYKDEFEVGILVPGIQGGYSKQQMWASQSFRAVAKVSPVDVTVWGGGRLRLVWRRS